MRGQGTSCLSYVCGLALCKELLEWAYTDKAIHITTFAYEKLKKTKAYLYRLADHYPQMEEALVEARELLAQKMVNACYNSGESGVNAVLIDVKVQKGLVDEDFKITIDITTSLGNVIQDYVTMHVV